MLQYLTATGEDKESEFVTQIDKRVSHVRYCTSLKVISVIQTIIIQSGNPKCFVCCVCISSGHAGVMEVYLHNELEYSICSYNSYLCSIRKVQSKVDV